MATRPIACPPATPPGFVFTNSDFVLNDGINSSDMMGLKDLAFTLNAYSRSRITLKASTSITISQNDIVDNNGFVNLVVVKVSYPEPPASNNPAGPVIPGIVQPTTGTPQVRKYLEWSYEGNIYYIGELMFLTGGPAGSVTSEGMGWNLSELPFTSNQIPGGITITNPHSNIDVKLDILIGR